MFQRSTILVICCLCKFFYVVVVIFKVCFTVEVGNTGFYENWFSACRNLLLYHSFFFNTDLGIDVMRVNHMMTAQMGSLKHGII